MTSYVIDASLAFKWLVPEEDSHAAMALIQQADIVLRAPDFFFAEIANGLYKQVKSGLLSAQEAGKLIEAIFSLNITPIWSSPELLQAGLNIAHAAGHETIYDCLYIAAAEQYHCKLLTADKQFSKKIRKTRWADLLEAWQ